MVAADNPGQLRTLAASPIDGGFSVRCLNPDGCEYARSFDCYPRHLATCPVCGWTGLEVRSPTVPEFDGLSQVERMSALGQFLQGFDWFTAMSDSHSVYLSGISRAKRLDAMVAACGRDGERLYTAWRDCIFHPGNGFDYLYPDQ